MSILLAESQIIENRAITGDYHLLTFENKNEENPAPGQFISLKLNSALQPFLRRPFAVFGFNRNSLSVLYKVVGPATKLMSQLEEGDTLEYLGFLGRPFKESISKKHIGIIAGGIGLGGISLFIDRYAKNNKLELYLGFNTKKEAEAMAKFFKPGKAEIKTACMEKSGSCFHGTVVEMLKRQKKAPDMVFACGPDAMLASLFQESLKKKKIPAWFSMESVMACGIGSCMGCTIRVREGNAVKLKRVCKDGPVFNAHEIIWE